MNMLFKLTAILSFGCLVTENVAAVPKMNKSHMTVLVRDRSVNAFTGVVLESRYVGRRNDPIKVVFTGTEAVNIGEQFSLEAVIHSTEKGSYVWKDAKIKDFPINYMKENPIVTRGDQWGISIKNNAFVFYLGKQVITSKIPTNWHRPITSHRLTGTYDGREMKLFLDCKLIGTKAVTTKVINQRQAIYAGGRSDKPALNATQIQVDDIRVYNRALSVKEIVNPLRRSQKGVILSSDIIDTQTLIFTK